MKVKCCYEMIFKLVILVFLFSRRGTRGAVFRPIHYSLNGVQAVNGSDQNGGCPLQDTATLTEDADLFTLFGERYCTSGTGVINDETASIGDLLEADWASGLLTIRRTSLDITSSSLVLQFKSEITPQVMALVIFFCPSWNIFASTVNLFSYHGPQTLKQLAHIDIQLSQREESCGLQSFEVTISESTDITSNLFLMTFHYVRENEEWVHIAELMLRGLEEQPPTDVTEQPTDITEKPTHITTDTPVISPTHSQVPDREENINTVSSIFSVNSSLSRRTTTSTTLTDINAVDRSLFIRKEHRTAGTPLQTTGLTETQLRDSTITSTTTPTHSQVYTTTQKTTDTSPQADSSVSNTIIASAVGSIAAVILLCTTLIVACLCIIFKRNRKSRQSYLAEIRISHLISSNAASTADSLKKDSNVLDAFGTEAVYNSKQDTGQMAFYVQNVAYVSQVEQESATHIYQEIALRDMGHTNTRVKDQMVMCDNAAYGDTAPSRQVMCVDNVAYASSKQI